MNFSSCPVLCDSRIRIPLQRKEESEEDKDKGRKRDRDKGRKRDKERETETETWQVPMNFSSCPLARALSADLEYHFSRKRVRKTEKISERKKEKKGYRYTE